MTITREQVEDLQPGDVVRLIRLRGQDRYIYEGPVRDDGEPALAFDDWWLRDRRGNPPEWCESLTVVSRAPRPLYVNHPRTEPVPGDVVRDADSDDASTWMQDADGTWLTIPGGWIPGNELPTRLRLLVDGETGLPPAVQS